MQYRVGKVFLWIGILAWFPYGILKYIAGQEVSVVPYLTVHLCGVIPGTILTRLARHRARKKSESPSTES